MTIKRRINQLEKARGVREPLIIITQYVDPDGSVCPSGGYTTHDASVLIHRMQGESDQELIVRLGDRGKSGITVLLPLTTT